MAQLESDLELISKAQALLAQQRAQGEGRLNGVQSAAEFAGSEDFLDGYVYGLPSKAGQRYELTILGDLHGCYSCLKAAIFQSRFLERVAAYRQAPHDTPFPRLVMLGDYIDRGRFSLDGVLRAVLTLFLHAPEHVHLLRGNHEFYVEHQGSIYGGVTPAEAIYSLKSHVPLKVLRSYKSLFDALPSVALIDGIVCVHGGAPRDSLLKTKWDDLSSLNLSECRFQMMWSDARRLDVVPAALQGATTRFAFGRLQAQAFLGRLGCHTMIRGHSRVENGFQVEYDDDKMLVMTVFSAGGADNEDIPTRSNYRLLTPMALSLSGCDGEYTAQPWPIDYAAYNHPDLNGFYAHKPELPMRRRPL